MEETLEEKVPEEVKDDQGGIRRRLRDRDLLRKRKAEAEEQATNQWVYGAESRKRVRREPSSTPRKKGRPRKNVTAEGKPENIEVPDTAELEMPTEAEEAIPAPAPVSAPVPAPVSAPVPAPVSAPVPAPVSAPVVPAPVPAPISAPVPVSVSSPLSDPVSAPATNLPQSPCMISAPVILPASTLEVKPTGEYLQEVLIEDLGPDEEQDRAAPQAKLVIDQDGFEPLVGAAEQNKGFSDAVFMSPPPDSLPGNLI